ncbi:MAG: hypothetical protein PHN51_12055 [Candidatus Nanopelagicales bacterium]|nr:hypothetical protein [Candidatus Nanopelagicales bacterium]
MTSLALYYTPNQFGIEGVDHYNISLYSQTQLGKVLDPGYHRTLNYPHIGKFHSVLNLWYWLKHKPLDDRYRVRDYNGLRRIVKTELPETVYVPNFRAIIGLATYQKLKMYPELVKQIRAGEGSKAFLSYHTPRRCVTRVTNGYASVIVPVAVHIAKAIRERREPDFVDFVDDKHSSSMSFLEGFIRTRYSSELKHQLGL